MTKGVIFEGVLKDNWDNIHYKVLIDLNAVPQVVLIEDILHQKKREQALIKHTEVINSGQQKRKIFSKERYRFNYYKE